MWRPRLPRQKDPAFWAIAGVWVGLPALVGFARGAELLPIVLVSAVSFVVLYVMTES